MRNGSMFGKLPDFKDPEYLQSHRHFHIYTENGVLDYEIFSAFVTYSASFVYTDHFEYSWDFYDFAQKSAESSIVDLGVEPNPGTLTDAPQTDVLPESVPSSEIQG